MAKGAGLLGSVPTVALYQTGSSSSVSKHSVSKHVFSLNITLEMWRLVFSACAILA